ncbi:MAG: hypothetical protein M5U01_17180 [Ardenticatenaceae bacterium]|nr:hypothetical protein [Ardenticatenaceae bacterium]
MLRFILFVLNNPSRLTDLLAAWADAGVNGATVLESTGLARSLGYLQEDAPLFPSVASLTQAHKTHQRVIFAVVDERVDADDLLARTEAVVGDLESPHTGIFAVMPVIMVKGLRKHGPGSTA